MPTSAHDERQIKPADLRGILKYVPMFRDHIFVIAIDGSIIEHENFANTITDIAVLRSLHIKVVLVHGIGKQLRDTAAQNKVRLPDVYGEGPTDATALALARETTGRVSHTIIEALSHSGLKTAVTNVVRATEIGVLKGKDQLFTGKVDKIDVAALKSLLALDIVPLVTPILCNREGQPLRVNSDALASEIATALGASKLIYLTPFPGLVINKEVVVNIPLRDLAALLNGKRANVIEERLRSKSRFAIRALENGTPRAHILDGRVTGGLLTEIFDKVGLGTMIHANDYDQIRPAKKKDAQMIHNITKFGVKTEMLVQRTRQYIEQHIDEYFVYEIDDSVIGCACLRKFADKRVMEVGSVYVQSVYQDRGVGKKLVEYAEMKAAEAGATKLFALTTQSHAFFRSICGFDDGTLEDLPRERRAEVKNNGRNSRILLKRLAANRPRVSRKKRP